MFRAKQFLTDKFGNAPGLLSFLRVYGAPVPGQDAAEKWFQRGSIPSAWLPLILAYIEIEEGRPPTLAKYLEGV